MFAYLWIPAALAIPPLIAFKVTQQAGYMLEAGRGDTAFPLLTVPISMKLPPATQ
jgi:hypothetical protein